MSCRHAGTAGPGGAEDCPECWAESHEAVVVNGRADRVMKLALDNLTRNPQLEAYAGIPEKWAEYDRGEWGTADTYVIDDPHAPEPPGLLPLTQAVLDILKLQRPSLPWELGVAAANHGLERFRPDGWTREGLAVTGRIRMDKPHYTMDRYGFYAQSRYRK